MISLIWQFKWGNVAEHFEQLKIVTVIVSLNQFVLFDQF